MSKHEELLNVSKELGIDSHLLPTDEGAAYTEAVVDLYMPRKTSGHLSIYNESVAVPLEENEFTYSAFLVPEPVYIFFAQEGSEKGKVVVIEPGNRLGDVLENAYGMEYFVSNKEKDYLLAVNWYVIEGAGSAVKWLKELISRDTE